MFLSTMEMLNDFQQFIWGQIVEIVQYFHSDVSTTLHTTAVICQLNTNNWIPMSAQHHSRNQQLKQLKQLV